MKPLYAIKHVPSGFYLPEPAGRMGRGGSHVEPVDCSGDTNPRLFETHRAALCALTQWLRGKHVAVHYRESEGWEYPSYEVEDTPEVIPIPSRKREEMTIVPINLVPAT